MNAKLMPQMPTIKEWLEFASKKLLIAGIPTNNLDAEIILAECLGVGKTYLHAHPEQLILKSKYNLINKKLNIRSKRLPIAYILGKKEFYGREFRVNKNTLIPRPESEAIVDSLKEIIQKNDRLTLIDVGTGSGCLGITAKLEFPNIKVTLIDVSNKALKVAKNNAKLLSADVCIKKNNLSNKYKEKSDIIIANLPYVDKTWLRSPETAYEPPLALFANENGISLIKELMAQANSLLNDNGFLIIEADPKQHQSLIEYSKKLQFKLIDNIGYVLVFELVSNCADSDAIKS